MRGSLEDIVGTTYTYIYGEEHERYACSAESISTYTVHTKLLDIPQSLELWRVNDLNKGVIQHNVSMDRIIEYLQVSIYSAQCAE